METLSLPTEPAITTVNDREAIVEVGSLYPGYGITLGNALRRVLLSSLPGAAITSVKIAGADHEFTTFPGIKEDVINILLNLKQVRFKFELDSPATITLKSKKEGPVKASEFKTPTGVSIVNEDLVIATITDKKISLEIEAEVSPGLGYELAERRKKEKLPVGTISLDAVYTPIRRANFRVENMRVGDRTDFNKLILELETDGSLSPEDAFKRAVEILDRHIHTLGSPGAETKKEE